MRTLYLSLTDRPGGLFLIIYYYVFFCWFIKLTAWLSAERVEQIAEKPGKLQVNFQQCLHAQTPKSVSQVRCCSAVAGLFQHPYAH